MVKLDRDGILGNVAVPGIEDANIGRNDAATHERELIVDKASIETCDERTADGRRKHKRSRPFGQGLELAKGRGLQQLQCLDISSKNTTRLLLKGKKNTLGSGRDAINERPFQTPIA